MQTKCTPAERAAEYLEHIAVLTGAKQDDDGTYHLTAGGTHFLVDYKFVRVISCRGESTCFSVVVYPDIPRAEAVAAALLQLKNNPRLFEKWRERQGDTFKANGQMFEETYRLIEMRPETVQRRLFVSCAAVPEAFSSFRTSRGEQPFRIALSIEKDPVAHQTLKLRSFFESFPDVRWPPNTYDHLRGQKTVEQIYACYPEQGEQADSEAWNAELGNMRCSQRRRSIVEFRAASMAPRIGC